MTHPPIHGGNLTWAASFAGCRPEEILDFSANINPLGPPQTALDAIQRTLKELRNYPDPNYGPLREAIARSHKIDPAWVLPGNGAAELLTWAGLELSQCDRVLLPLPAFGDYGRALSTFGATVRPVSAWNQPLWQVSSQEGLLVNNPHNPTGQLWPRWRLRAILETAQLVVADEAFMDFLEPDSQESLIDWVQEFPNLVVLRSLTKFYSLPGLRLGYAISHPDRLRRWQRWRDSWSVNVLAAAAGVAVLGDYPFQKRTYKWLKPAKHQLWEAINAIPGLSADWGAANFLLVRTQMPGDQLQRLLLREQRIFVRDCLSFQELGDRFVRVAVKRPQENRRLVSALEVIFHSTPYT
ncbi:MAG: threonine-phosphate decarboxylase [Phormidium sp. GEM2.Bin31]|nr:MAG: threonine-phosphate decarboxylase [Phormidium sp. GEM2.Bin31]